MGPERKRYVLSGEADQDISEIFDYSAWFAIGSMQVAFAS